MINTLQEPVRGVWPVMLTPFRADGSLDWAAYRWSSYRPYVGREKVPEWLACGPVLAFCGRQPAEQRRAYGQFVESAFGGGDEETGRLLKSSALAVGGQGFIERIRAQLIERGQKRKHPDDTGLRTVALVVPVDRVLGVTAEVLGVIPAALKERRRNSDLRGVAARLLCRRAGLTQRETAAVLGVASGAAVALQLQRLAGRLAVDRTLRRQMAAIEKELASCTTA